MKTGSLIFILLAGIFWGTSGIFVHYLAPYGISSVQMTAVRGIVSFIPLAIYALIKDRGLFRLDLKKLLLFAAIGAAIFGTATLYYTTMQMTSVSTAVVLMYTAPIYVMAFSVAFLGERLSGLKLASVVVMLAGCCFVSGVIGGLKFDFVGILLGVLTGIVYAAYNILTKIAMKKGCSPVSTTMYSFLIMGIIAIAVCDPARLLESAAVEPTVTLPLLVGLGILTCVLPYFLYTLSLKQLSAGTASALAIFEPMSATLFSVFWLGEDIGALQIIGIVLILVSVVLLSRTESMGSESKREGRQPNPRKRFN